MNKLFDDLLDLKDVNGTMIVSFDGDLIYENFSSPLPERPESREWRSFVESLNGAKEANLAFEKGTLYVRKTKIGYLVVLMGFLASAPMVRLTCDVLLPSINKYKKKSRSLTWRK
ncbi:MAG: hypothetical protein GY797_35495 [Deltaproteobacteria bacterium]|nr:hypothetical protein [Deltaproteobacteria bacterium]